mgnify:CR=1 FL=1
MQLGITVFLLHFIDTGRIWLEPIARMCFYVSSKSDVISKVILDLYLDHQGFLKVILLYSLTLF